MSNLLSDLKSQTRSEHDQIEKTIDFLRPDMTLEDYKNLLKKFYGFYHAFEDHLKKIELPFDYSPRFKISHLEDDLKSLGLSQDEMSHLPIMRTQLPSNLEDVLGQLYVIEGSTLGGMVLKKHFEQKFSLTPRSGLAFFSGYGPETMKYWKEFQEILIKYSSGKPEEKIINSAKITFHTLETWMK